MSSIERRIADMLYTHYDFSHLTGRCECGEINSGGEDSDRDHVDHVASVLVAELGLQLACGGRFEATNVKLSDEELDRAGFTYHRVRPAQ